MTRLAAIDNDEFVAVGTLITVGFMPSPFSRLFDQLLPVVSLLPRPIVIQSGTLETHKMFEYADRVVKFSSTSQMSDWIRQARIVISHAGVGTTKAVIESGKMPIVVPRIAVLKEHIDDHQVELAEILSSKGIAAVVSPESTYDQFADIITRVRLGSLRATAEIRIEPLDLQISGNVLLISSVGGHRHELASICSRLQDCRLIYMTDEMCDEVKSGAALRFPSCNKRRYLGIRFLQALSYLMRHAEIRTIITTGAGVGAVFVAAAKLLGVYTISIESMTRIKSPGLWFKLAGRISDEVYAYSWSQWLKRFPRVKKIDISIIPTQTSHSNEISV